MGAVLFSLSRVETLTDILRFQASFPLAGGLLALVYTRLYPMDTVDITAGLSISIAETGPTPVITPVPQLAE